MEKRIKIRLAVLIILVLACLFSFYFYQKEDRGGVLKVAFLNIGQGDAIFIESPNGNQMLIDGGPDRSVLRELSSIMPFYDKSIDVVIATHADQDHVGGLPDVLKKYNVSIFMEPGVPGPSSSYEEVEKIVESMGKTGKIKKMLARRGMTVDLGNEAKLKILFPDRDPSGMDTNTASIVAKLVYGGNEFLLTGDSPTAIEHYLVSLGGLESDVLKAGHHGSRTSSSDEFVTAVSPEYAVISAGKNNKYGHPHQEVLDILKNHQVQILSTAEHGRIIFKSDGEELKIK